MKTVSKVLLSTLCVAAIGGTLLTAGCADKADITITGSSSVSPLMSALAEAYMQEHDTKITIQTSDSGTGVADAANGSNSFGMASRALRVSEEANVGSISICLDGVALVVNNANTTITNLTGAEVYDLYASGTVIQSTLTNAISRESGSGTRDAFDGLIQNGSNAKLSALTHFANCVTVQGSTGTVKENIASNTAGNTLGYISMGSLDSTVKAVSFEGVAATIANVQSGDYKLSRPFNIVYNLTGGIDEKAEAFIRYIFSDAGQEIIEDMGYVPLAAGDLAEELGKLD